jgi:hypothetical protein
LKDIAVLLKVPEATGTIVDVISNERYGESTFNLLRRIFCVNALPPSEGNLFPNACKLAKGSDFGFVIY